MRWLTLNPEPLLFRFRFSDEAAPPLDRLLHAEARVSSKNPVRPVQVVRGCSFFEPKLREFLQNVFGKQLVDFPVSRNRLSGACLRVAVPVMISAMPY